MERQLVSLVVALKRHCSIEGETNAALIKEIAALSPEDRAWFKGRFEIEYPYTIKA